MKCTKLAALVIFSLAFLFLHDSRLRAQGPDPGESFEAKVARLMADLKGDNRDARLAAKNELIQLGPKALDIVLADLPAPLPPKPKPMPDSEDAVAARMREYENLVWQLGSLEPEIRDEAHKKLLAAGRDALPVLKKHTDDTDAEIRTRVREIISEIEKTTTPPRPPGPAPKPTRDFIPDLLDIAAAVDPDRARRTAPQMLDGYSLLTRFEACRLVCEGDDAQTVETLTKALDNDLLIIRSMAIERLAQIGDESAAQKIIKSVDGANPILDKQAVDCAARLAGAKIKPALAELLKSKQSPARAVALYGLGLVKDAEHAAEMLDFARSPDMLLRLYGCRALAALGDKKFASPIIDAVLKGEIPLDYGPRVALLALASSDDADGIKKMFDSTDSQIRDLAILLAGKHLVPLDPDRLVEYALVSDPSQPRPQLPSQPIQPPGRLPRPPIRPRTETTPRYASSPAQCANAAWTLGRLKYTQFIDELINACADLDSRRQLKSRLIQTIAMMAEKKHERFFLDILAGNSGPDEVWLAAWGLARSGDADTVDALVALLEPPGNRNRFPIWLAICSLTGKKVDYNFLNRTEEEAKTSADSLRVWWTAARKDFKPARDMSYFPGADMSADQALLFEPPRPDDLPLNAESALAQTMIIMCDALQFATLPLNRAIFTPASLGRLLLLNVVSPNPFLDDVFRQTRDIIPAMSNAEKFLKDKRFRQETGQDILNSLSLGKTIQPEQQQYLSMLPNVCRKIALLMAEGDEARFTSEYETCLRLSLGGEADFALIGRAFRSLTMPETGSFGEKDRYLGQRFSKAESPRFEIAAAWGADVETFFPSDRVILAALDYLKNMEMPDWTLTTNLARSRPSCAGRLNLLLMKPNEKQPLAAVAGAVSVCNLDCVRDFLAGLDPAAEADKSNLASVLKACKPPDVVRCLRLLKPEVDKLDVVFRRAIASSLLADFNLEGCEFVEKDLKMTADDVNAFDKSASAKFALYLDVRKNLVEKDVDANAQLVRDHGEAALVPFICKILRDGTPDEKLSVLRRSAVTEYGPVPRRGEELRKQSCLKNVYARSGPVRSAADFFNPRHFPLEIVSLLNDKDADVRAAAARALLADSPGRIPAAPLPLIFHAAARLLEDPSPEVRFVAVKFVRLEPLDVLPLQKPYYERLLKLLDDKDAYIRASSMQALSHQALCAAPYEILREKATRMLDAALPEEKSAALDACAALNIPLSPARLSEIIATANNWDDARPAFVVLGRIRCPVEQKTLDKIKEFLAANPEGAGALRRDPYEFVNKDFLLVLVETPDGRDTAVLKTLALLADPSLAELFESVLKNPGPTATAAPFGVHPPSANNAALAVLGLVKLGKIEKKTVLDWFFTGKDLPKNLNHISLSAILPEICDENDVPLLIQWSANADRGISDPASAALIRIRSMRTLDSLVAALDAFIAQKQFSLMTWNSKYIPIVRLALIPPKDVKTISGPFGMRDVDHAEAAAIADEIKNWWAENRNLAFNAVIAKSLKKWPLQTDALDDFSQGKDVSPELLAAIYALVEKQVADGSNFQVLPGWAGLLEDLTGRAFSFGPVFERPSGPGSREGPSDFELALARFRLWFLSSRDYMYWDNKALHFEIDWDARAALVPLAVWRNIPEADRKNWDNLDQAARDKLIEDARKKS